MEILSHDIYSVLSRMAKKIHSGVSGGSFTEDLDFLSRYFKKQGASLFSELPLRLVTFATKSSNPHSLLRKYVQETRKIISGVRFEYSEVLKNEILKYPFEIQHSNWHALSRESLPASLGGGEDFPYELVEKEQLKNLVDEFQNKMIPILEKVNSPEAKMARISLGKILGQLKKVTIQGLLKNFFSTHPQYKDVQMVLRGADEKIDSDRIPHVFEILNTLFSESRACTKNKGLYMITGRNSTGIFLDVFIPGVSVAQAEWLLGRIQKNYKDVLLHYYRDKVFFRIRVQQDDQGEVGFLIRVGSQFGVVRNSEIECFLHHNPEKDCPIVRKTKSIHYNGRNIPVIYLGEDLSPGMIMAVFHGANSWFALALTDVVQKVKFEVTFNDEERPFALLPDGRQFELILVDSIASVMEGGRNSGQSAAA